MGIWELLFASAENSCLTVVIIITTTSDVTVVANIEILNFTVVTKVSIIVLLLHDEA